MCFGHTHKPYHRTLNSGEDGKDHFRHAINIGSVGKPKDGNPQGSYVILIVNNHSSILDSGSVQSSLIRFNYDVEKAAKAVENSPLPNDYAESLRKGI
jgi:hypothetical protein